MDNTKVVNPYNVGSRAAIRSMIVLHILYRIITTRIISSKTNTTPLQFIRTVSGSTITGNVIGELERLEACAGIYRPAFPGSTGIYPGTRANSAIRRSTVIDPN